MTPAETNELPSSLYLLVDPTEAMQAAQRLYAASGNGLRHSGWNGCTVPRGQPFGLPRTRLDEDFDDSDD